MTESSVEDDIAAVRTALYLTAIPSHSGRLQNAPLPDGVCALLRIVANDGDAIEHYSERLEKAPTELREAAAFYIEQNMLSPNADSYRVLGTRRHASAPDLRRNFVLLCRWLHSDLCDDLPRSIFLLRVTQAWNDLKTPERRRAYDAGLEVKLSAIASSSTDGDSLATRDGKRNGARKGRFWRQRRAPRVIGLRKGLWWWLTFGHGWRVR